MCSALSRRAAQARRHGSGRYFRRRQHGQEAYEAAGGGGRTQVDRRTGSYRQLRQSERPPSANGAAGAFERHVQEGRLAAVVACSRRGVHAQGASPSGPSPRRGAARRTRALRVTSPALARLSAHPMPGEATKHGCFRRLAPELRGARALARVVRTRHALAPRRRATFPRTRLERLAAPLAQPRCHAPCLVYPYPRRI